MISPSPAEQFYQPMLQPVNDAVPLTGAGAEEEGPSKRFTICVSIIAQGVFLVTGIGMVLLNQVLANCGVNSPYAGFVACAKGFGFGVFSAGWAALNWWRKGTIRDDPSVPIHWRRLMMHAGPVAAMDLLDTVFETGGIVWAKSGLFVIVFSSITVWVALMRKFILKRCQVRSHMFPISIARLLDCFALRHC